LGPKIEVGSDLRNQPEHISSRSKLKTSTLDSD
jgi:hypothetical protein